MPPRSPRSQTPTTLFHPTPWWTFLAFPNWLFILLIPLGLVLFYSLFLTPVRNVLHARAWLPTPCTILSASVRTHDNSKSTTYSPEIRYQYQINQHTYTGSRFNFSPFHSTSSYNSALDDLKSFPPRTHATCYVNPNDPSDAVLLRDFTPSFFLGLAPLLFTLAGASALLAQLSRFLHARHPVPTQSPAPRRLPSNHEPLSKFFAFLLVTALFLLIFYIFFNDCLAGWRNHNPDVLLTIVLVPLALFLFAFLFATVSLFVSLLRTPRASLTLSADPLTPAAPATLHWRLSPLFSVRNPQSAIRNVTRLRIDLVGFIDTATSTTAAFNKSPFTRISLLDTTDLAQFPAGSLTLTPPPGPPSFFLPYNRIRWTFNLLADFTHADPLDLSFQTHLFPPPPLDCRPEGPPRSSTNTAAQTTLTLSLPHSTYPRSSILAGTVSCDPPHPQTLHLTLLLHTTGRGLPESRLLSQSQIPLSSSSPHPFSFPLPPTLSPSHTHELLSLHYSLELSATSTFSTRLDFQVA